MKGKGLFLDLFLFFGICGFGVFLSYGLWKGRVCFWIWIWIFCFQDILFSGFVVSGFSVFRIFSFQDVWFVEFWPMVYVGEDLLLFLFLLYFYFLIF